MIMSKGHRDPITYAVNSRQVTQYRYHHYFIRVARWASWVWVVCRQLHASNTKPKITVRLFGFSPLALLFSQKLSPACTSFLLPFPDIVPRLLDTLLDMLDLGCHVAIDLVEKVDEFYKLLGGGS